jgi:HEAT repeat protein
MRIAVSAFVAAMTIFAVCAVPGTQQDVSVARLLGQFKSEAVFWRQFEVGKKLATVADRAVLEALVPLLAHEDRHVRANAPFVFARLGDCRGFETLKETLSDNSDRPPGQGVSVMSFNTMPRWSLARQIEADRYYAVHILGELKERRAVEVLLPLLADADVNYKVMWALGEIGDRRAVRPLIKALQDVDPFVRVSAILALETLHASEAVPQLHRLLNDQAIPRAGPQVPVADTARAAIAKLQKGP